MKPNKIKVYWGEIDFYYYSPHEYRDDGYQNFCRILKKDFDELEFPYDTVRWAAKKFGGTWKITRFTKHGFVWLKKL